jgi:hypothetical protein
MTANVALALARRSLGIAVVGVSLLRIRLRIARAGARHSAERGRSLACTVSAAPRAIRPRKSVARDIWAIRPQLKQARTSLRRRSPPTLRLTTPTLDSLIITPGLRGSRWGEPLHAPRERHARIHEARAVIGRLLHVEYVPMLTEPLPMRLPVVIRPRPFILRAGAQGGRGIERDAPQRDGIPCFRHP